MQSAYNIEIFMMCLKLYCMNKEKEEEEEEEEEEKKKKQ